MKNVFGLILAAGFAAFASGASACPDQGKYGDTLRIFSGKSLYHGQHFDVRAGGAHSVAECEGISSQSGYVQTQPDFTFHLHGMEGYNLMASVMSECDSVILVNMPDESWRYNDEVDGDFAEDAGLMIEGTNGLVDIWVGTYGDVDLCDATLSLETFEN